MTTIPNPHVIVMVAPGKVVIRARARTDEVADVTVSIPPAIILQAQSLHPAP